MDNILTMEEIENAIRMSSQNASNLRLEEPKPQKKSLKPFVIFAVVLGIGVIVIALVVIFVTKQKKPDNPVRALTSHPVSGKPFFPTALVKSQMHPNWKMEIVSTSPVIQTIGNFLDEQTCAALIALAEPRLKRSTVVDSTTGKNIFDSSRTSYTVFFKKSETPLLKQIQKRAAEVANVHESYLEGLQVVRYKKDQYYRPHFDYLPRTAEDVKQYGQRTATIFAYLNDLPKEEKGGGTKFPKLNKTFRPKRGSAVLWHNMVNGKEDPRTLHSGEPLESKDAIKYGLNIWIRELPQKDP
jgi:hypothetical protein